MNTNKHETVSTSEKLTELIKFVESPEFTKAIKAVRDSEKVSETKATELKKNNKSNNKKSNKKNNKDKNVHHFANSKLVTPEGRARYNFDLEIPDVFTMHLLQRSTGSKICYVTLHKRVENALKRGEIREVGKVVGGHSHGRPQKVYARTQVTDIALAVNNANIPGVFEMTSAPTAEQQPVEAPVQLTEVATV
jgi:hypothetical protein